MVRGMNAGLPTSRIALTRVIVRPCERVWFIRFLRFLAMSSLDELPFFEKRLLEFRIS